MTARPKRASSGPASRNDGPDLLGELAVDLGVGVHVGGAQGDGVLVAPIDRHPEAAQQVDHCLDVRDARDVADDDLLLGEQAGGQDRQRGVLVPGRE